MADNFNMKKFLTENKLGPYAKNTVKENRTAEDLFQMFKDEDLVDDRREYDEEDLMSAYPDLSSKEAEKLVSKLQNINEKIKIEESLSLEAIDRMEDLANIQDLAVLKTKLMILTSDWNQEGFEKEDILEYIKHLLDKQLRENSYLMAKNPNVKTKVDKIIGLLIDIDVDGETMEYILGAVGMHRKNNKYGRN